jgi:hypothetical protein
MNGSHERLARKHRCQATLKEPRPSARRSILRAREIPLRGSSSMKLRAGVGLDRWLVQTNSMGLPMGLARSGLGQGLPLLEKRCKLILSGSILSFLKWTHPEKPTGQDFFKQNLQTILVWLIGKGHWYHPQGKSTVSAQDMTAMTAYCPVRWKKSRAYSICLWGLRQNRFISSAQRLQWLQ